MIRHTTPSLTHPEPLPVAPYDSSEPFGWRDRWEWLLFELRGGGQQVRYREAVRARAVRLQAGDFGLAAGGRGWRSRGPKYWFGRLCWIPFQFIPFGALAVFFGFALVAPFAFHWPVAVGVLNAVLQLAAAAPPFVVMWRRLEWAEVRIERYQSNGSFSLMAWLGPLVVPLAAAIAFGAQAAVFLSFFRRYLPAERAARDALREYRAAAAQSKNSAARPKSSKAAQPKTGEKASGKAGRRR
ncbi:hypothetical protein P3T35_000728 [Kitasatospora sp. GP30]|uniref:hypothetical protein n=1 Tax=Kitasatospora sp. GP30 TaxID=3035084 RepID=UPI000C6FF2EA|nr:hypothetical protein [Kitasatospora sp. GP30]MDH6138739.1 hypothetical protein [Kitasatospora sp. GP30]